MERKTVYFLIFILLSICFFIFGEWYYDNKLERINERALATKAAYENKKENKQVEEIKGIEDETPTLRFSLVDDDGSLGFFNKTKPILDKYNFKASLALVTDDIEYTEEQISQLINEGYELLSHSTDHGSDIWRIANNPSEVTVIDDAVASKEKIMEFGGNPDIFVYPYGNDAYQSANPEFYQNAIDQSGYKYGIGSGGNLIKADNKNDLMLSRMFIDTRYNIDYYKDWIDNAIENNQYLIFGTHSWDDEQLTAELLDQVMGYIDSKGYIVGKVSDLIVELEQTMR